jgi:hypothetical protein
MEDFEHNNMNRGLGIDFAIFTLGPDDTSGPMVADYVPRVTSVPFDHLDITFSEPIQWSTFSRADITLLDPQGREIVVSDPELLEGTQFRIHFATQTAYGDYQLLIGPWIEDLHGNPMNQNKNTENGEGDLDRFDTTVVLYDKEPPYVEMMTVQNEGVGSVGYIDLTFSEEIDPRTFTTDDIVILGYDSETQDQYYASQIEPLNDTQFRVYTRYKDGSQERPLDRIQAYDIRVGSELCDMWGNTMDQRVKGGSTRHYRKEFPVCSGFAAALNLLNTEQDVMTRIRTSIVNALHMEFPDVQLPDELGLKNLIGEVPLIAADLLSGAGRTAFFRITAGGAITGTLGFSFEAAGITPSLGAHLRRDIAKVEQGLVIEATQVGGTRMYKIALALTGEHSLLFPVVFSGEAEAFLEFPEDFSECTLGYTFSPAVGTYILAELASKVQLDFEVADIEAEFALLVEMEGYLEAPLTLSATLSPEAFIAAMDAQDLPSALNRYVVQCALSAWPGTNRVGNLCGLVGKAMGQANSWNLSTAFDLTGAAAMGSKAGLGGGFELPCETAEMGIEVAFSVSAGMRQSVNLFQKTVKIPLDYEPSESGAIFNGDFEQGLMTWISPSGRSEAVSDGSGGTMALLRGYVSELSRSIFVPANATNLSFNYAFSPNVSSSSLFLQLNGQTVWQASGGPAGPSVPVQVDVSAFSGQMYEVRFLFWNPEDANALVTIDDVSVQRSDVFDFSDSFDSAALNPSRWNWVTPVGGPTYSLILSPGSLRLMTPNTQVFDCWGQTDQMPRLTYEGITGNWSIETRLSIPMSLSGGAFDSGIFVRLSANDYLTHGFTFGGPWLSSARTGTGQFLPFFSVDTNAIELRITRRDDDYRFFYRRVGDTEWIQSYELMSISREPESVGLFTKTWQAINTQADFDYFQIVSCP